MVPVRRTRCGMLGVSIPYPCWQAMPFAVLLPEIGPGFQLGGGPVGMWVRRLRGPRSRAEPWRSIERSSEWPHAECNSASEQFGSHGCEVLAKNAQDNIPAWTRVQPGSLTDKNL